jgi:hypothetical protein
MAHVQPGIGGSMIHVIHQGASWNVLRDGEFVMADGSAGVFLTKEAAVEYAHSIAERTGEPVDVESGEDEDA